MSRRRAKRPPATTDKRTPDERLEALVREPNAERAQRMLARILDDLDLQPEPGPWLSAARTLSERLIISEDTFYYFAEKLAECLTFSASRTDPELMRLVEEMTAIERAHGLRKDQLWPTDEAPEEWRALDEAWGRRADAIVEQAWRDRGHADLADLHAQNRKEFDRRSDKGEIDLWGEEDDD